MTKHFFNAQETPKERDNPRKVQSDIAGPVHLQPFGTIASNLMDPEDATILMNAAAGGDQAAVDRLLPLVCDQLRRAAELRLANKRASHTLSATAIVHEAYLRLVGPRQVAWAGRGHFYAAVAESMRRILIDHARGHRARGGGTVRFEDIAEVGSLATSDSDQVLTINAALIRLENEDPEAAAVVRLRFYAGLSVSQAVEALGLDSLFAARLCTYARAVLFKDLSNNN